MTVTDLIIDTDPGPKLTQTFRTSAFAERPTIGAATVPGELG